MQLSELCTREVVGIPATATLREAAALMCEEHVGSLVAMTDDDPPQVVGIITDRDLALDGFGSDAVADLRVGHLVRGRPLAVPAGAGVREAAESMERAGVRRLLVVDEDGGVVGLVSADDLLEALASDLATLASALRGGIEREKSGRGVVTSGARARVVYPAYGTVAAQ